MTQSRLSNFYGSQFAQFSIEVYNFDRPIISSENNNNYLIWLLKRQNKISADYLLQCLTQMDC